MEWADSWWKWAIQTVVDGDNRWPTLKSKSAAESAATAVENTMPLPDPETIPHQQSLPTASGNPSRDPSYIGLRPIKDSQIKTLVMSAAPKSSTRATHKSAKLSIQE